MLLFSFIKSNFIKRIFLLFIRNFFQNVLITKKNNYRAICYNKTLSLFLI